MILQINAELSLSTEHSASSYGRPVALFMGRAYGPADELPQEYYDHELDWIHESARQAVAAAALRVGLLHHPLVQAFE